MKVILSTLKKILFWSYERGSWQYDVMCVLILAFIFLSPNRIFQTRASAAPPIIVRSADIGPFNENNLDRISDEFTELMFRMFLAGVAIPG